MPGNPPGVVSVTELQMFLTQMELQMVSLLIEQHHQQRLSLQQALQVSAVLHADQSRCLPPTRSSNTTPLHSPLTQASLEARKCLMKPASDLAVDSLTQRALTTEEMTCNDQCPVCLGGWGEDEPLVRDEEGKVAEDFVFPTVLEMPCKHCFHDDCLKGWLKRQNTCPVCRTEIDNDSLYEEDVEGVLTRVEGGAEGGQGMHVVAPGTAGPPGMSALLERAERAREVVGRSRELRMELDAANPDPDSPYMF